MRIHALQTGSVRIRQAPTGPAAANRAGGLSIDARWTAPSPILCYLVEHPEGLILIDSGQAARPDGRPAVHGREAGNGWLRWEIVFDVAPSEEVVPRLGELGYAARDVRWLVLTHLHSDHAGGARHFPTAEVLVAEREYAAAGGDSPDGEPRRWPAGIRPKLVEFEGAAVGPFAHSHALTRAGDVLLVPTVGHTPGHLSVVVRADGVQYFVAGDASFSEEFLRKRRLVGVPDDTKAARQTLKRVGEFAAAAPTVYLPAHDADAPRRLAERAVFRGLEAARV